MSAVANIEDRIRERFRAETDVHDARSTLERLLFDEAPLLTAEQSREALRRLHASVVGLGPLHELCADEAVTDVLVNGPGEVWVERDGVLEPSGVGITAEEIALVVERVLGPLGLRVDRAHPIADGRLADGSRISVVVPPLAVDGTMVSIRRFAARPVPLHAFAPAAVIDLLEELLHRRSNLVIFGGTGSGKTTLLNAMAGRLPRGERILTIEDAAELRLPGEHVVRLEARPANAEGVGAVCIRELVRAAMRLRPDRIIVGEVRGPEALDMLWAMSSGHDGSLSTCHAASPVDVLLRLETFVLTAGVDLPLSAVRAQVRSAIDVLVGIGRGADGTRAITTVAEVDPDPSTLTTRELATGGRVVASPSRSPRAVARS